MHPVSANLGLTQHPTSNGSGAGNYTIPHNNHERLIGIPQGLTIDSILELRNKAYLFLQWSNACFNVFISSDVKKSEV